MYQDKKGRTLEETFLQTEILYFYLKKNKVKKY